jgi:hypothetical protein
LRPVRRDGELVLPELLVRISRAGQAHGQEGGAAGPRHLERDGKASGWTFSFSRAQGPSAKRDAPSPIASAAEVTLGGIPVKKIAVRVAALGGGIAAILLAGGAWVRG